MPKEELLDNVWGDRFVSESALTSRIKAARRVIGDDGSRQRFIGTVHGRGYRLVADVRHSLGPEPPGGPDPEPPPSASAVGAATLLEREAPMAELLGALRAAGGGAGRVVFVGGEAGVGKTALVQRFAETAAGRANVLIGAADDLSTPRVLGAIREIVEQLPSELGIGAAEESGVEDVLARLAALARSTGRPVVAVLEDIHWADDATFDVVRYVARRIRSVPLVLVLTYRDTAAAVGHPLRQLLGAVRGPDVVRIALGPLSPDAVATLAAGSDLDPAEVFRVTGGNPLFVSEVVAAPSRAVPDTVPRRGPGPRRAAAGPHHAGAAAPGRRAGPGRAPPRPRPRRRGGEDSWTAAEQAGLLDGDTAHVWFRHELVRQAVEETLTASERLTVHRFVAGLLHARAAEPSRIVHHAAWATTSASWWRSDRPRPRRRSGPGRTAKPFCTSTRSWPTPNGSRQRSRRSC